jgi:hypothetical protein
MHLFTKLYLALGTGLVALFGVVGLVGGMLPAFGPNPNVDTSSRQGYWYTYRQPKYEAGPGRSPGSHGGSYGGGGYSGGK